MDDENSTDTNSTTSSLSVTEVDVETVDTNTGTVPKINPNPEKTKKEIAKEKAAMYLAKKKLQEEIENQKRKEKAMKSMMYLLEMSESYSKFFKNKITDAENTLADGKSGNIQPTMKDLKNSKQSKSDSETKSKDQVNMEQLKYFVGGTLKPYQVEGVTWMKVLYENALNGILADEMGLGKTVQVIALMCHLYEHSAQGPFLIVAPLSTLGNWNAEFKRFAPKIPVVLFHGSQAERPLIAKRVARRYMLDGNVVYPVVLISYQTPLMESHFLQSFSWEYVIVDEGHRLKNHESRLSKELKQLKCCNKLLLTGTPMQNNITELWSLLNFLMPFIFKDMKTFTELIMLEDVANVQQFLEQEEHTNLVSTIHRVLAPFMLRRLKKDVLIDLVPKKELLVYCPLTSFQKELYTYILEKNLAKLSGKATEDEKSEPLPKRRRRVTQRFIDELQDTSLLNTSKPDEGPPEQYKRIVKLQNPMVMFKKTVDHPYLIHIPFDPNSAEKTLLIDEDIVTLSGKMMVLDAMLAKLKEGGHKVLIFSTLVMMLDLIEEYMVLRDYSYCRLDGQHNLKSRTESIAKFNKDPNILAFLISTRAGGLGLNLTGADTVIFFDRDWNPQVDIQAQDRCHRIGQKKPVVIYTLVTKNTIDEKIINCGVLKRRLEKIVIQDGRFKNLEKQNKSEVESELLRLQELLKSDTSQIIHSNGFVFSDAELNNLLDRSDLYSQMNEAADDQ